MKMKIFGLIILSLMVFGLIAECSARTRGDYGFVLSYAYDYMDDHIGKALYLSCDYPTFDGHDYRISVYDNDLQRYIGEIIAGDSTDWIMKTDIFTKDQAIEALDKYYPNHQEDGYVYDRGVYISKYYGNTYGYRFDIWDTKHNCNFICQAYVDEFGNVTELHS